MRKIKLFIYGCPQQFSFLLKNFVAFGHAAFKAED